jgi:hypothetical protein
MQTDRPAAPRLLVRNPPHRVMLAVEALEASGFSIRGNIEELDSGRFMFDCLLPSELRESLRGDNPDREKIISYQADRARRALKGFAEVEVKALGSTLIILLPPLFSTPNFHPRPGRRPGTRPEKEAAAEAKKLLDIGIPFDEIETRLGDKFGHRDPQSWRRLLQRHFPPTPKIK